MSTYKATTGRSIEQAFEEFDGKNPHVYTLFKKYVRDAINAGRKRVSAKTILGVIRWYEFIKTEGDAYKINDAFSAYYCRKYLTEFPEHYALFELRRLRS